MGITSGVGGIIPSDAEPNGRQHGKRTGGCVYMGLGV